MKKRIVIAAGHYPNLPGCSYFGLIEHREAQIVVTHLGGMLRDVGYDVMEVSGTLHEKIKMIADRNVHPPRKGLSAAVEVHFNAGAGGHGTECLYGSNPKDKELAEAIQRRLVDKLGLRDRGTKFADYWKTPEVDECAWPREIDGPAVIVEPLFLSCKDEAALLRDGQIHAEIANGIFEGIDDFLGSSGRIRKIQLRIKN